MPDGWAPSSTRSTTASTRATIAFCLEHGEAKVLITDREFAPTDRGRRSRSSSAPLARDRHRRPAGTTAGERLGEIDYEALLAEGDPGVRAGAGPRDEWEAICLLYTSGTTGDPKGVVYHHRGAYLNALGNALAFGLVAATRVYLWTLPMFHCSGWTYTWAVTAVGRHARVPAPRRSRADLPGDRATTA